MNIKEVNINMERGTTDRGADTKEDMVTVKEVNTIKKMDTIKEATMDVGQLHMRLIKNYIVFRQESHLLQTP